MATKKEKEIYLIPKHLQGRDVWTGKGKFKLTDKLTQSERKYLVSTGYPLEREEVKEEKE